MIHGRFGDTTGRAFLEAMVAIPGLGISRRPVSFLFDTGADHTVLMPTDALRIGIDYSKLSRTCVSNGIGGKSMSHVERAILIFNDPEIALYTYDVDILVKPAAPDIERVPSLLGRDITDRWKIIYHGEMKQFAAEPVSYDHRFDIV